jgi:hypothetical protein
MRTVDIGNRIWDRNSRPRRGIFEDDFASLLPIIERREATSDKSVRIKFEVSVAVASKQYPLN